MQKVDFVEFVKSKTGMSNAFAYGHANKKKSERDFKNKLEATKIEKASTAAFNFIPTFDSSTGIIIPF